MPLLLVILAILLTLSGFSALVYQVLWTRLLSLTFGVTIHAASTVLGAFMGGLAVGSYIAGRLADRARRPLQLFGIVELLIGACALVTPLALAAVHLGYVAALTRVPESPVLVGILRIVLLFAVLIVPTALMGATLPIVMKSSLGRRDAFGARAGLLYASNTAGAIAGALIAGLYLIPQVGLRRSFLIAAGVNAFVGLSAIVISRAFAARLARASTGSDVPYAAAVAETREVQLLPDRVRYLVLGIFAVSGFASLALEIVWFRVLVMFLGPTSYAFTLMLAMVLTGIAVGSYLVAPLMRRRWDWVQILAILQMGAALVALVSFNGLRRPPRAPQWLEPIAQSSSFAHLLPAALSSAVAILPTAIFFGLAFPVGLKLWSAEARDAEHDAERIGLFYSVNVFGGILGAIAAGFVLLPLLSSRGALILLAGLFMVSGVVLQLAWMRKQPVVTALSALAVVAFIVLALDVPRPTAFPRFHAGRPVLWQEEGPQTTVTVFGAGVGDRVMYIDSHHQANDSPAMVFIHRRIGLLPAVLHPSPKRALVVGLGGGATAGALSMYPGITVDVVELSGGVVRGAAHFAHVNFDILRRPNVQVRVDDGRNFLLRTRTRYDVITADAIVPTNAGANNLYSAEYFRLVEGALAPNGIALHWNGATSPSEFGVILRAFLQAFPHTTLWGDGKLMVGFKDAQPLSRSRIDAMLADPVMREVLSLMNIQSFDHLGRMFRAGPEQVRAIAGTGPYLTDDRPLIEYFATLPGEGGVELTSIRGDINTILKP